MEVSLPRRGPHAPPTFIGARPGGAPPHDAPPTPTFSCPETPDAPTVSPATIHGCSEISASLARLAGSTRIMRSEQVAHGGAEVGRKLVHASLAHASQGSGDVAGLGDVLEWIDAGEDEVEHDAHRPDVHGLGVVARLLAAADAARSGEHLGGHVVRGTDAYGLCRVAVLGQSEIDDLERPGVHLDHAVLGLDVAMAEAVVVDAPDAAEELAEEMARLGLGHDPAETVEVVQHVHPLDELPDQDQDVLRKEDKRVRHSCVFGRRVGGQDAPRPLAAR